jgi:hypothetical protein
MPRRRPTGSIRRSSGRIRHRILATSASRRRDARAPRSTRRFIGSRPSAPLWSRFPQLWKSCGLLTSNPAAPVETGLRPVQNPVTPTPRSAASARIPTHCAQIEQPDSGVVPRIPEHHPQFPQRLTPLRENWLTRGSRQHSSRAASRGLPHTIGGYVPIGSGRGPDPLESVVGSVPAGTRGCVRTFRRAPPGARPCTSRAAEPRGIRAGMSPRRAGESR